MENWCQPLQKMGKVAVAPQKCVLEQNSQLLTPLKFGSPVFQVSMEMENWCRPLQKMEKNGHSSPKTRPRAKLPITDAPEVWVSGFLSVNRNGKLVSAITENGKNGCSSPKMHPRAKLPIIDPLKFGLWFSKC